MIKVVKKNEAKVRRVSDVKWAENLIDKNVTSDVSLAVTESKEGYEEKEVCKYNRIYYVLKGSMVIECGDQRYELDVSDACFIPRGTEYLLKGVFRAVVVNQPAFGSY